MTDCLEVLFISDSTGKVQTANCIDPRIGTTLMSYKGGNACAKKCLCVIGKDYLLSAEENKPVLHVWHLNSQEPAHDLKIITPGKPSALSVSPDGHYCVGGIDGKIYVWLISSGCLLNVVSKHFQAINKIIFLDDSSHFITAGEDGLVLVWKLADVVAKQSGTIFKFPTHQITPVYNFSQHSLPVLDIFVGRGNMKGRLFSVSVDQTCKIFCLSSGIMLVSLMFSHVLTSVITNELETELFVGSYSGKIFSYNLDPYPRTLEHHVPDDTNVLTTLIGHTKPVNHLSISLDGVTLASGSDDGNVFLWNIPSKQLIKSFEMKGPISNMFFHSVSNNIFSSTFQPSVVVSKFERISNPDDKDLEINVWVHENMSPISFEDAFPSDEEPAEEEDEHFEKSSVVDGDVDALKQQITKLKEINKQLYQFAMNKILKNPLSVGMKNEKAELQNSFKEIE